MHKNTIHPILIHGEWQQSKSPDTRDITNPATLEKLGTISICGSSDVDAAVESAARAQKSWWKVNGVEKALLLRKVATHIRDNTAEIAELLTLETGKPLVESHDCVDWVAACFEYYSEVTRSSYGNSVPPVAPHQINFTIKEPYGVVAAITPFNFPLLLLSWKVAPAIAAGNTVVCKPPHQNPLSTLLMAKAFELLPPGVVNVITGDGPTTGEDLIKHENVDVIAFTGSTTVGRHIASVAGSHLKKCNLELGGIDPFIVCEDADLDVAARGVAWARLLNAGQVCTSAKRIYVVKKIEEDFTRRVLAYVESLKVGNPLDQTTDVGPVISSEALEKIEAQVKTAIAEGAVVKAGGKRCSPGGLKGHYFEPTVLTQVRHGGICTKEEIFGPVIAIISVSDVAEAITLANDSRYGLGANIYTNNLQYAMTAMENIKAGTFWINDPLTDNDAAPFGGMRLSGVGRELGEEGLDAYREPKHVHLDYVMEAKNYWYPYKKRTIAHQGEKHS